MKILLTLSLLPALAAGATKKNLVFYLEDRADGGCRSAIMDVDTGATRTFFDHALACPQTMKWEPASKTFYFQIENKLYSLPWKKQPPVKQVASFDHGKAHPEGTFQPGDFWFSAETGKLRHAYLAPLSSFAKKEVGGMEEYEVGFEGRTLATKTFLGIGTPYMAVMVEWRDGKWARITQAPTTADAGDTLGFSVLPEYSDEGARFVRLRLKKFCDAKCVKEKFDGKPTREGVEHYFDEQGNLTIATEIMGDTVHTSPPLLFCKDKKCDRVEDPLHSQLYVAPRNGWVLVGYEFASTPKTYLFRFPSTKPRKVLATAHSAAWFPYDELWDGLE